MKSQHTVVIEHWRYYCFLMSVSCFSLCLNFVLSLCSFFHFTPHSMWFFGGFFGSCHWRVKDIYFVNPRAFIWVWSVSAVETVWRVKEKKTTTKKTPKFYLLSQIQPQDHCIKQKPWICMNFYNLLNTFVHLKAVLICSI